MATPTWHHLGTCRASAVGSPSRLPHELCRPHCGPQRMERADAFDCGGIVHGFWGRGTGSGVEAMHPATKLQQQEFAERDSQCGEMVPPCCQNLWVMFATVLWSAALAGDWPYWLCQGRSLLDSSLRCALEDMSWVSTALFAVDWAGALAPLSRPAQLFCLETFTR